MKFSVFQVSRKGSRKNNEDRMGYCYTRSCVLMVLADGMGGHPQGEVASQLALQSIVTLFQKQAQPLLGDVAGFLEQALLAGHQRIVEYAAANGLIDGPRTTLVMAVLQSGSLSWTHCGDSRLYLVRQAELLLRSKDHSLAQQHRSDPPDAAPDELARNVLFSCLGPQGKPVFNVVGPVLLHQGDRVMLCSDGLWSAVSDADIVRELADRPVHEAVPELVEKALRQSGSTSDNVTCIALAWDTPDAFALTCGGVTTDTLCDNAFHSTVPAELLDAALHEIDDDSIERSIAEINAAIRRTARNRA